MMAILMPIQRSYILIVFNGLHNFTRLPFWLWCISARRFGGFGALYRWSAGAPGWMEEPKLELCDHRVRLDIATATAPIAATGSQATTDGQRVKSAPHNSAASA